MESHDSQPSSGADEEIPPWVGLGRAFGGAIIFSLPMMMTMEMWQLGFYMDRYRLLALVFLSLPLFFGIARIVGFRGTKTVIDDGIDVCVAYAVAMASSAIILVTFGVITLATPLEDVVSKIFLLAVPAALGGLLGRSVIGTQNSRADEDPEQQTYTDELVILTTGAVFLAFNLAPTEEIVKLAYQMTSWHTLALMMLTLVIMHGFSNATTDQSNTELKVLGVQWSLFLRFTCTGYVLALLVSLFILWTFSRTENQAFNHVFSATVVLGFPTGIGASASRLLL